MWEMEAVLEMWQHRSHQDGADMLYMAKLNLAARLLHESKSMPDYLARLAQAGL
jgi:hypothetical protein